MVKFYCDRCRKEVPQLIDIKVPTQKSGKSSHYTRNMEVCGKCNKEFDEVNEMLADMRLTMFSKYLEKGGEG